MRKIELTEEVKAALRRASVTGDSVVIAEQLPRPLYEAVNKVLAAYGGRWDRRSRRHLFAEDPRAKIAAAIESGEAESERQKYQEFYTPAWLGDRLARLADVRETQSVLEPSAGPGALVSAILGVAPMARVYAVDCQTKNCEKLMAAGAHCVRIEDFLAVRPGPDNDTLLRASWSDFDAVVMNPPFAGHQDVRHVAHAYEFLRPGGVLVSVMPPGWRTGRTKLEVRFRAFVAQLGAVWEPLPDSTFADSDTHVRTGILSLRRPA